MIKPREALASSAYVLKAGGPQSIQQLSIINSLSYVRFPPKADIRGG
jgi:hypothetical protein